MNKSVWSTYHILSSFLTLATVILLTMLLRSVSKLILIALLCQVQFLAAQGSENGKCTCFFFFSCFAYFLIHAGKTSGENSLKGIEQLLTLIRGIFKIFERAASIYAHVYIHVVQSRLKTESTWNGSTLYDFWGRQRSVVITSVFFGQYIHSQIHK